MHIINPLIKKIWKALVTKKKKRKKRAVRYIVYHYPSITNDELDEARRFSRRYSKASTHEGKKSFSRDYPKTPMVDKKFKLHPKVIEILTRFKKARPYKVNSQTFLNLTQALYYELSKHYNIRVPPVRHVGQWKGPSAQSHYSPATHRITLAGKRSIITALHEFMHARGYGETAAVWWSINCYKLIWPKSFKNLRAAKGKCYLPSKSKSK